MWNSCGDLRGSQALDGLWVASLVPWAPSRPTQGLHNCSILWGHHLSPPQRGPLQPTPPLTAVHFTAIVKHNDSYPGEKLDSILYFIASKRTFFNFPQSAASRNKTINQQGDHCVLGRENKQRVVPAPPPHPVSRPQHHLVASGPNTEWGRDCGLIPQRRAKWEEERPEHPNLPLLQPSRLGLREKT